MVLVDYQPMSGEVSVPTMMMNELSEHGTISVLEPSVAGDEDPDPSSGSLEDLEDLLLEAGLSSTGDNISKSMLKEGSGSNRTRSSSDSSSSFSDGSFLTAATQHQGGHSTSSLALENNHEEDDTASSTGSGSSSSGDYQSETASEPDLEAQSFLRDQHQHQMAPAPPGEAPPTTLTLSKSQSNEVDVDDFLPLSDTTSVIPVIALDHLKILPPKVKPLQEQLINPEALISSLNPEQQEPVLALDTRSTISAETDDQHSVASVQSLVSVVAELIAIPIRVMYAAIADLEHEIAVVTPVSLQCSGNSDRAEFLSVSILKCPIDMDSLGLTVETDTTKDGKKQVLVIQKIDANGPWAASPLAPGDRIVSINHVPVSHWAPAAVHHYWSTLTDSVSMVAHNPSGDAQKVAVMITKPDPSSRTGLGMRSSRPGRVKISRVNGLFHDTLLSPGDLILSINSNGVEGCSSADTANTILQAKKFVTIIAKSSSHNAFVISTNQRPNEEDTEALVDSNSTGHDQANANQAMERDTQTIQPRPEVDLSDRCDSCGGGGWATIQCIRLAGNLYVTLLFALGLFLCFDQGLGFSFIVGVLVLSLFMAYVVNVNVRQIERQLLDKERPKHCGTFQMSANILAIGAFAFLMLMWRQLDYTIITSEFVIAVGLLIMTPMLLFINMPSFCVAPRYARDFEFEDDYDHSAVASLASRR